MTNWFFEPLQMFGYDVVDIDPPTEFKLRSDNGDRKSASAQYKIMSWDDLAALPVGQLVRCNGIIALWAAPPTLKRSMWLLERWGAEYKTELVWPKGRMGTGYRARGMHESVLLGVFGNECQIHDALYGEIKGKARGHSQKPVEWYRHLREKTPGLERLCLFSRENHEGFTHWGDEVGTVEVGARVPSRRKTKEPAVAAAPLFDLFASGHAPPLEIVSDQVVEDVTAEPLSNLSADAA